MTNSSGTAEQILSLPRGGGAVRGLGETFQPDFHTGTGSYAIPLDLPNGPNDIAPKLTLLYSTAAGGGPFGMGFGLNLLTIGRSTNRRVPTYTDGDPLVLHGGGELVDVGGGRLRLRHESADWRIARDGDGFRLTDADGRIHHLGSTEQARRRSSGVGPPKVLDWLLERIEDPLGNRVDHSYLRDDAQLYLEQVRYGPYTVTLRYETRPDPILDGRAGFLIRTRLRCTAVELTLDGSPQPLLRRWDLAYGLSAAGHSLLREVTLTGFDETGAQASLPVLRLGYSGFAPRRLQRFRPSTPTAEPGARLDSRRELVDWDGDGLPDLLELGAGQRRVWPNLGDCTWGPPRSLAALPVPVGLDEPGTAFADMAGDGTADLLMLDRALTGYYPHRPKGGFDRPVRWRQAPAATLTDPDARLVDLDADGIADLLVTGEHSVQLHLRSGADGWRQRPVTIPRPQAPPVRLRDPRVHLADMTGDGLQDLVRVDGAGVVYWPYLGNGTWAAPVTMANPPALPPHHDPQRLFLSDIDGDGCADLVYVDADRILYWLNGGGARLGDQVEVARTPPAPRGAARLADMRGSGTAGVFWSCPVPGRPSAFFYLDFTGGAKPYLLSRIDNGMGLVTEISYGTSTQEAVRDRRAGRPWPTFLPFAVPVVTAITATDQPTGRRAQSRFRYHDGHYDGTGREFAGFRTVEISEVGDATAPTMLTRNTYHLGLDPADLGRPLTGQQRRRLRTLRGKLLAAEVFGLDGSPDEQRPYTRTESAWHPEVVASAGDSEIFAPRLLSTTVSAFERQPAPFRVTTDRSLAFDADGRVTEREQIADDPRDATRRRVLRTTTSYAADPAGRIRGRPARTSQLDGDGTVVSTTINYYDGLPAGQIGAAGLLTRIECLVLRDATVTAVYGASPPDLAALGYHRRAGEDGWWIDQVAYSRTDDAAGPRGTTTNALGRTTQIAFDPHRIHPVRLVDPLGNVSAAEFDLRANKIRTLTDANGATITNRYDPLGRLLLTIEPGADEALPTTRYDYQSAVLPAEVSVAHRAVDGRPGVLAGRTRYDGLGQLLEERSGGPGAEVIERAQLYSSRGLVRAQFLPRAAAGPDYTAPTDDLPHQALRYDAIGRLIEIVNPDGSARRYHYTAGAVAAFDEEDTRAGGPHADTPTRTFYDPTGRVAAVVLDHGGGLVATQYEHDIKGNLIAVTEADGRRSAFAYDLLGRRLRTQSPSSATTTFLFDAGGNLVRRTDAAGEAVEYTHDALDRLSRVSFPATGEVSAEYTYHDTGTPAPPGAGPFTRGRPVAVTHQGGREVFGYDALGRVTSKTVTSPDLPGGEVRFDYSYRADGQRDAVTYPAHAPGAGRLQVRYDYDDRGRPLRIPGFVRLITYNAAGQRTRVEHANGVVTTYAYDPLTMRVTDIDTTDPAGTSLQSLRHAYDLAGNLLAVDAPDPRAAATYAYDPLYRLTAATRGAGESWAYAYDDVGNLTAKSDVGAFTYDADGRLAAAGASTFTYTPAGQTRTGPSGLHEWDPHGRLLSVTNGAERTACGYDHDGRRVSMRVDGGAAPLDVLAPDELLTIENGVFLAVIMDSLAQVATVRLDTGAVGFVHGDRLGSTTLVTGPTGDVLQRTYYDPFGAVLDSLVTAGADETRRLYTGAELDAATGLVYLRARYYQPEYGRFLSPDTLVPDPHDPGAWNRYSYVQNNPLRYVDPTGHFWEEIGGWFADNWQAVVAVVAIIAVVVLTVVTFGAGGLLAVGIGMAIGGAIGGISAAAAGGDVLLGILVGMAVGGAAAFAGLGIGAGMAALVGKGTLAAALLTGTLSGAVTGAAMGFATGYAGGAGNAAAIWDRMWKGALVGAVTGLALGGLSYGFQHSPFGPRMPASWREAGQGIQESAQGAAKQAGEAHGVGLGTAAGLVKGALTGSQNTGGYWLSPLLGGGSVLGGSVGAWQISAIGLTSAASGVLVLDWADDLWKWATGAGLVKISYETDYPKVKQ
ncbi:toxin TcdB middle/N-terminal domain-containing protein [Frankia sp. QA3]|uniref:toxin TcdB middle/N-terminal domain-containing protein n=1 Tax=Frankia sp. QA3 TaxID=710111 RepID=UPI000269BC19|nr:toxin TcdB middle/N-terminal domain-containing protein [Frankia sp. QA3]EIV91293.1 RHS repeat-associated core domain protein [Frankia sp. QA3]